MSSNEPIIIENEKNPIQIIIVDTSEDANKEELMEKINMYQNGILVLSDRAVISTSLLSQDQSIYYSSIYNSNIQNKEEFMNLISGSSMINTYIIFFATVFVYLFIVYFASNIVDGIMLGILGYIFARIVRLRLKFKATFNIGMHALTLPIILNLIYIIVRTFTGFTVSYFQWMYEAISYIYVAVAILMIKTEIINQKIQLIRLEQIQAKATEEEEKEEERREKEKQDKKREKEKKEKDEKKEEKKKNKENNGVQPEGSNA